MDQRAVQYRNFSGRDSAVGIATGYGLVDWRGGGWGVGVRVPARSRIFSYQRRVDRLWGPPNLLFNGCRGVKLTTHLQLLPRSRKCGSMHPLLSMPSLHNDQLVRDRDNFTYVYRSVPSNLMGRPNHVLFSLPHFLPLFHDYLRNILHIQSKNINKALIFRSFNDHIHN
jgi:hypothetical protein